MIKRACVILSLLALFAAPLAAADWKGELMTYINRADPDYAGALAFMEKTVPLLEGDELQSARAMVPFLASRSGGTLKEEDGMAFYLETYMGNEPDLSFLDRETFGHFLDFWRKWKGSYPLLTDISFLSTGQAPTSAFPSHVEVGLKAENDTLYRVALGDVVIEGGLWKSGFHILKIPVADLFDHPGSYDFMLFLKSGDVVIRKPIRLAVELSTAERASGTAEPVKPVLPAIRKQGEKTTTAVGQPIDMEGVISLYVDGRLVSSSRKFTPRTPAIDISLGGPQMVGQKPYLPPPTRDIMANSVSILDAVALAYSAFKDLLTKKKSAANAPVQPTYQKTSVLSFSYSREAAAGRLAVMRAVLTLSAPQSVILRE